MSDFLFSIPTTMNNILVTVFRFSFFVFHVFLGVILFCLHVLYFVIFAAMERWTRLTR